MYTITQLTNGKWHCEVVIQDGTERWDHDTREEAVRSVISGARVLNGSYIREDDITFLVQPPKVPVVTQAGIPISEADEKLLQDIRRGAKKVLDFDHFLLKYRLTREEADLIVDIREGKARVIRG
jgi:hypothetical protein